MNLSIYRFDIVATQAINRLSGHNSVVDAAVIWTSAIAVPVLVLLVAFQWWRRRNQAHVRHVLVAAGLTFLVGLALNQMVLLFVNRTRPYDAGITHLLVSKSTDPSFPSDHATATMAIAIAFILHGMRRTGAWFMAAAAVVMFSRVYIGTHYVSDVLGGSLTALLAALVVLALYREGTCVDRAITSFL